MQMIAFERGAKWLVFATVAAALGLPASLALSDEKGERIPQAFAGIEETLRESGVPIRLPGELPTDEGPLFVELREVGSEGYRVEVALAEDCRGATACRYLEFETRRLDDPGDPLPGEPVELDRGIQGFFEDFVCAASCGDASLRWIEDGVLYAFHLKAGSLETLVRMFRSIERAGETGAPSRSSAL